MGLATRLKSHISDARLDPKSTRPWIQYLRKHNCKGFVIERLAKVDITTRKWNYLLKSQNGFGNYIQS